MTVHSPVANDAMGGLTPAAQARGTLRDVLAAVRNFEQLLQSPRVGARSLDALLPSIRDVCASIEVSLDDLVRRITTEIDAGEAAVSLSVFGRAACARLARALESSASIADAKTRLSLEADIIQARGELDAVRELADLLRGVREGRPEVSVEELVHEALSVSGVSSKRGSLAFTVTVVVDAEAPFPASPQLLMPMLAFGVGLVHQRGVDRPSLRVRCPAGGSLVVRVSGVSAEGDAFVVEPPMIIPPTLACLEAAARESGGRLTVDAAGPGLTMLWPR